MATQTTAPILSGFMPPQQPPLPNPAEGRLLRSTPVTNEDEARRVVEDHRQAWRARRQRDLTCEKYLVHMDGEGDGMWADVYRGSRVAIPLSRGRGIRLQENLLRIVDTNMIAYHTGMPYVFGAENNGGRESRERAVIDARVVNSVAKRQRLNNLVAECLAFAVNTGFCPLHVVWRDDLNLGHDPIYNMGAVPGTVDLFTGNPFDTFFREGARANSWGEVSYGRVLPAEWVRQKFNVDIEGNDRLPSASTYQRVVRKWLLTSLGVHGTGAITAGKGGEELVALICKEWDKGVLPDHPDGRLMIVGLRGASSTDREDAGGAGEPMLLHDAELPAGVLSPVLIYSHSRFDDVTGKPFNGDLDDLNVHLNQMLTWRAERIRRLVRPPLFYSGNLDYDGMIWDDDVMVTWQGDGPAPMAPQYLSLPMGQQDVLINQDIEDTREAIWRIGGYQAPSRGEGHAGDPAAKVVALQTADDTVHGPTNVRLRQSLIEIAEKIHANFRAYADVPWVLSRTGNDQAEVVQEQVGRQDVSQEPPTFRLLTGFGATPEAQGKQLMTLVTTMGADGQPLLETRDFRRQWIDDTLFDEDTDPEYMKQRRAKRVAASHRLAVKKYREQTRFQDAAGPALEAVAQQIFNALLAAMPPLRDDDINAHIAAYSEITQDESEDPLTRRAMALRQDVYWQWQAEMYAQQQAEQQQQQLQAQVAGHISPQGRKEQPSGDQPAGNDRMGQVRSQVREFTAQAQGQ